MEQNACAAHPWCSQVEMQAGSSNDTPGLPFLRFRKTSVPRRLRGGVNRLVRVLSYYPGLDHYGVEGRFPVHSPGSCCIF